MRKVRFLSCVFMLASALFFGGMTRAATPRIVLPDLRMDQPGDPRINVTPDGTALLKFSTPIWNIGEGRLQIRLVENAPGDQDAWQDIFDENGNVVETRLVGDMLWHPEHDHYHMKDVVQYDLRQSPDGPNVRSSGKISICFMDLKHIPGWPHAAKKAYFFEQCYGSTYGISPGWMDEYPSFLPFQWIDVTGVPDGEYYVVQTVDINHTLTESDDGDESNNSNWVKVRIFNNAHNIQVLH